MERKITPFRKICALVAISLIALGLVAPAFATTTALLDISEVNVSGWQALSNGGTDGKGHNFQGNDQYLSSARFYLKNTSAAISGNARAYLINASSSVLTSDVYPVETTAAVSLATIAAPGWITFYFANTTILLSSNYYTVNMVFNGTVTGGISGGYYVSTGNLGGAHVGGQTLESWSNTNQAQVMKVYTVDAEGGDTEPYTPPGTADTTSWDAMLESFISFIVPLIVMLLPAMLLMFLTRRTDKWLLIIGIAIGAGLGYYFGLVPLWLVFLVVIGLIGMAYQSVRGGNS